MSIAVLKQAWENTDLVGSERFAMIAMAWKCGNDFGGSLYPSISEIAGLMNVTAKQARRIIHSLIEKGYLEVVGNENGGGTLRRQYQIRLEKLCLSPPAHGSASGHSPPTDGSARAPIDGSATSCNHDSEGSHGGSQGSHGGALGLPPMGANRQDRKDRKDRHASPLREEAPPSISDSRAKVKVAPLTLDVQMLVDEGVSREAAEDFLALRKDKRAPLTRTAWKGIKGEIDKTAMSMDGALTLMAARGWIGFNSTWDGVTKKPEPRKFVD